ncbi:MarR family transcriptional regulator [Streptomyces sp. SID13031]|uniref:MarR family winged helix-turn-helix transcriptional regulator n=1 Tax=Streptomyces sp. SID13031 TaxID=2706046 RepID=UPI0013C65234|nr:MarR family transcriptional regulator [Streptomyces sp. SID13031]NEA35825.1 MarR family transcriptional regulator [Streptomyces sp. SID13031]
MSAEGDAVDSLVQTSFTVMAVLSQAAAAHDLSLTQLRVLAILRDREPKMAELAAHLGLDRSSVSGLIDRAVKRDLVRRTASTDDARAVHVSLTPAGQRLTATLTAEIADLLTPLTTKLAATDQKRLATLLTKLLD